MFTIQRDPAILPWAAALVVLAGCSGPADESGSGFNAAQGGVAAAGDPVVSEVQPPAAPQDTTLDIRVLGANYDRGSRVDLLIDGLPTDKVVTNSTRFRNQGELIANVTIAADATVTRYDVLVTTGRGKKGIGIEKFEVQLKTGAPFACVDDPHEQLPLSLTVRGAAGDALLGDGLGSYASGTDGSVHLASNGNLMFWVGDRPRSIQVTTSLFNGSTTDRIYTNNHGNPGGENACGFHGMVNGSQGTAVLEVELDDQGIVRYGKNCQGDLGTVVPGTEATTTRSLDGNTWTIEAQSGIHCKVTKVKGKTVMTEGTAGPVKLTFTALP